MISGLVAMPMTPDLIALSSGLKQAQLASCKVLHSLLVDLFFYVTFFFGNSQVVQ